MTRINYTIEPSQLTDQHLLAEIREITRVPNAVLSKHKEGKEVKDIPENFTLGTGHMKFFYNKLLYILGRYRQLIKEAEIRGFNVSKYDIYYREIKDYYNFVSYDKGANKLLKERISNNINNSNQTPRYYGKEINKDYYFKNILRL